MLAFQFLQETNLPVLRKDLPTTLLSRISKLLSNPSQLTLVWEFPFSKNLPVLTTIKSPWNCFRRRYLCPCWRIYFRNRIPFLHLGWALWGCASACRCQCYWWWQTHHSWTSRSENANPLRGRDHRSPLEIIELGDIEQLMLAQQGYTPDDILPEGKRSICVVIPTSLQVVTLLMSLRPWIPLTKN